MIPHLKKHPLYWSVPSCFLQIPSWSQARRLPLAAHSCGCGLGIGHSGYQVSGGKELYIILVQLSSFRVFYFFFRYQNGQTALFWGLFLSPFILWFPTLLNRTSSVMIPLFCSVADWNFTVNFKFRSVLDPGALLQPVNPEFVWVCCIKFCSEKNRRQAWIKARTPYWNKPSSSKLMHGSSFIFFQDFDGFGVQKSPMIHYPCAVPPSL